MATEAHLYELDPPSMLFFGAQVGHDKAREDERPTTCRLCGGYPIEETPDDPLARNGLDPRSGRMTVWVCICGRTRFRNPIGRIYAPNQEALDHYGDLTKRDSEDRTVAAVKLSKRGKAKPRKAS